MGSVNTNLKLSNEKNRYGTKYAYTAEEKIKFAAAVIKIIVIEWKNFY